MFLPKAANCITIIDSFIFVPTFQIRGACSKPVACGKGAGCEAKTREHSGEPGYVVNNMEETRPAQSHGFGVLPMAWPVNT